MAMPASGCIALRTCITGCACSSIACAVNGSAVGNCSLSSLSTSASIPIACGMRGFYGYAPVVPTAVNFSQLYYNGGDGSTCSYSCTKPNCPTTAGDCYCLCTFYNLCVDFSQSPFSYAIMCVRCNGIQTHCCCINYSYFCVNAPFSMTVRAGDGVCIYNYAREFTSQPGGVRSQICISSIVDIVGSYCRGTTCCNICRYTNP